MRHVSAFSIYEAVIGLGCLLRVSHASEAHNLGCRGNIRDHYRSIHTLSTSAS